MARKDSEAIEALVLDTSAILSVILAEPGHQRLLDRISDARSVGVGSPTFVEAAIVLSSKFGRDAGSILHGFLRNAEADLIPFGQEHADMAVDAFLRFGKARHPASLNYGDCLSYAIAAVAGLPLLYTGDDFSKTDILSA